MIPDNLADALNMIATMYANGVTEDKSKAVEYYEAAANHSDAKAMYSLACAYEKGIGVQKDLTQSIVWLKKASDLNDPDAVFKLGMAYMKGEGVVPDRDRALALFSRGSELGHLPSMHWLGCMYVNQKMYVEARPIIQKAAELGYRDSMFVLGSMLENGSGNGEKDLVTAMEWYHKAADLGHCQALYRLSKAYWQGDGVDKDSDQALQLLKQAASLGHAESMHQLGFICCNEGNFTEGKVWFERSAALGYTHAMVHLALVYKNVDKDYERAVKLYQKAADLNNIGALFDLGCLYESGVHVPQDLDRAIELYDRAAVLGDRNAMHRLGYLNYKKDLVTSKYWNQKASELGHPTATHNLGCMYDLGEGVDQDVGKAFELFKTATELGCPLGMSKLGRAYATGRGVEKDSVEAVRWTSMAAERNECNALFTLGMSYHRGYANVIVRDPAKAIELFIKAADLGHSPSMCELGNIFSEAKDYTKAIEYYQKAIQKRSGCAMYRLATMYLNGVGVDQDSFVAFELYEKAAEQGVIHAIYQAAVMLEDGWGVEKNESKSVMWYEKGVALGHSGCMNNLAFKYQKGIGVQPNLEKAVELFLKAATAGHTSAMFNLGQLYSCGMEMAPNDIEAVKWFRMATDLGHRDSMYNMAFMYEQGRGIRQDLDEAARLYQQAIDLGQINALIGLGCLYFNGKDRKQEAAVELFRRAADQGNAMGMRMLGDCYRIGTGVPFDVNQALEWYQRAKEAGDEKADEWIKFLSPCSTSLPKKTAKKKKPHRRRKIIEEECAICMLEMNSLNPAVSLSCGHNVMHASCKEGWVRHNTNLKREATCPICRSPLS